MLRKTGRQTIGVIVESLHESYQSSIWEGITEQAQKLDLNVVVYIGTSKDRMATLDKHYTIIQEMVDTEALCGLIIFSGVMAEYFTLSEVKRFCLQFKPLPMVSIALKIDGMPSILIDNRTGILCAVNHLAAVHGCSKIAFVKGPEGHDEAEIRFLAYRDGLTENGLSYDPSLVFPGNFIHESGVEAVQQICANGITIDAIIAADDTSAIGAVSELRRQGIGVPHECAVIGFDDIVDGQFLRPALTTIQQPLKAQGRTAVDLVERMMHRLPYEREIYMPTRFIQRQSCGCFSEIIQDIKFPLSAERELAVTQDHGAQCQEIVSRISRESLEILVSAESPSLDPGIFETWLSTLITAFCDAVKNQRAIDDVLHTFNAILMQYADHGGKIETWHRILNVMNNNFGIFIIDMDYRGRLNHLLHKSRILISDMVLNNVQYETMQREQFILLIRQICQRIITTFDLEKLAHVVTTNFPLLSIKFCFIALYDKDHPLSSGKTWAIPRKSRIFAFYDGDNEAAGPSKMAEFQTNQILPSFCVIRPERKTLVFLPLFFNDEHFGYMLLDHLKGAPNFIYEEIRLHLGSAIKSTYLLESLTELSLHDSLTGLYNRRGFITLGEQELRCARRQKESIFIMYADVDNLKEINDVYGHLEGDQAIVKAAELLRISLRSSDIIGRIGGDEFTVLSKGIDESNAERIVHRICENFDLYNSTKPKPYIVAITIGSMFYRSDVETSFEEMLVNADTILLKKKRLKKRGGGP